MRFGLYEPAEGLALNALGGGALAVVCCGGEGLPNGIGFKRHPLLLLRVRPDDLLRARSTTRVDVPPKLLISTPRALAVVLVLHAEVKCRRLNTGLALDLACDFGFQSMRLPWQGSPSFKKLLRFEKNVEFITLLSALTGHKRGLLVRHDKRLRDRCGSSWEF